MNEKKSLREIARAMESKLGARRPEWTSQQASASCARIEAAIRMADPERLEAALRDFGGLAPLELMEKDPLSMAAEAPGAFGFERLMRLRVEQMLAEGELDQSEHDRLRESLRKGMIRHYWDAPRGVVQWDERVRSSGSPLLIALRADSPMALAALLEDERIAQAIVAGEPQPDEMAQTALIWHAVSCGAIACAALLARDERFNALLVNPGSLRCWNTDGREENPWRVGQNVFEEESEVEWNLFEEALWRVEKAAENGPYGERGRVRAKGALFLSAAMEAAGSPAKAWRQKGTGLGWPEIAFARLGWKWADEESAQTVIEALEAMGRAGFEPRWELISQSLEQAGRAPRLAEWTRLREQIQPKESKAERKKTARM